MPSETYVAVETWISNLTNNHHQKLMLDGYSKKNMGDSCSLRCDFEIEFL